MIVKAEFWQYFLFENNMCKEKWLSHVQFNNIIIRDWFLACINQTTPEFNQLSLFMMNCYVHYKNSCLCLVATRLLWICNKFNTYWGLNSGYEDRSLIQGLKREWIKVSVMAITHYDCKKLLRGSKLVSLVNSF